MEKDNRSIRKGKENCSRESGFLGSFFKNSMGKDIGQGREKENYDLGAVDLD